MTEIEDRILLRPERPNVELSEVLKKRGLDPDKCALINSPIFEICLLKKERCQTIFLQMSFCVPETIKSADLILIYSNQDFNQTRIRCVPILNQIIRVERLNRNREKKLKRILG